MVSISHCPQFCGQKHTIWDILVGPIRHASAQGQDSFAMNEQLICGQLWKDLERRHSVIEQISF